MTEEQTVVSPPRRPLIWPWLALLLLLVAGGIAAAYLLTRDEDTTTRVPNVVGQSTDDAVRELGQRGYRADVQARVSSDAPPGRVLSQAPAAGTELDRGNPVTIVAARGPERVEVPRVVGLPAEEALVRLQAAELKGRTREVASNRPRSRVLRQSPAAGAEAREGSTVLLTTSRGPRGVAVPSVVGATEPVATSRLERAGFVVRVARVASSQPRGIVIAQEPSGGARAARGAPVALEISTGPTTTTTTPTTTTQPPPPPPAGRAIPDVIGLAQRDAIARLHRAGFRVDSYPAASSRPRGAVVAQRPAGGTRAAPNALVRIDVSLGSGERPLRTVPDVVGMPEREAKQALVEAGFTVRGIDQPTTELSQQDVVLAQRPAAGAQAPAVSQVILTIGRVPTPT